MKLKVPALFSISIFLLLHLFYDNSTLITTHKLKGVYCSFSSDSWFLYDFFDDSTFEFRTEGHFGRTRTKGSYIVDLDTIRLSAFSKEKQTDTFYFSTMGTLVILNDSCLVSTNNEVHCKITPDGGCYHGFK